MKLIDMLKEEKIHYGNYFSLYDKTLKALGEHTGFAVAEDTYSTMLRVCYNCGKSYISTLDEQNVISRAVTTNHCPHCQEDYYKHPSINDEAVENTVIYYIDLEEDDHCQLDFVFYRVEPFANCSSYADKLKVLDRFNDIELEPIGRLQFYSDGDVEGEDMEFSFNRFVSSHFIIGTPNQLKTIEREQVKYVPERDLIINHQVIECQSQEARDRRFAFTTIISRKLNERYQNHDALTCNRALQYTLEQLYVSGSQHDSGLVLKGKNSYHHNGGFNVTSYNFETRQDRTEPLVGFLVNYYLYKELIKENPILHDMRHLKCFRKFIDKYALKMIKTDAVKPTRFHRLFKNKKTLEDATGFPREFFEYHKDDLEPRQITFLQEIEALTEPMSEANYYKYSNLATYFKRFQRIAKKLEVPLNDFAVYVYEHVMKVEPPYQLENVHVPGLILRYLDYLKFAYYAGDDSCRSLYHATLDDVLPMDINWCRVDYDDVGYLATQRIIKRHELTEHAYFAFDDPDSDYEMIMPQTVFEAAKILKKFGIRRNMHTQVRDPLLTGSTNHLYVDIYFAGSTYGASSLFDSVVLMKKKSDPTIEAVVFVNRESHEVRRLRVKDQTRCINTWQKYEFNDFMTAYQTHLNTELAKRISQPPLNEELSL